MADENDDYIDKIINSKPAGTNKSPKHKMTIHVDHNLWQEALPYLDGKFGALMEGALREFLERVKRK